MIASRPHRTSREIFAWPIVIGIASVVGLLAALIGDGFWDWVSWATLLPPLVLCAVFLRRGRKKSKRF